MGGSALLPFLYDFAVWAGKIFPSLDTFNISHFQLLCYTGGSNIEMYADTAM
jgi:hypothetical protein